MYNTYMDILSHGLWGSAAFFKKPRKQYWLAFFFGVFPDLVAFGPLFLWHALTKGPFTRPDFATFEPPRPDLLPGYVWQMYQFSHSLFIFAFIFGLVWYFRKRPFLPLVAWGLHILMDIPTHTTGFFPTPFLYPFADVYVNGMPWSTPWFFVLNWSILLILYISMAVKHRRRRLV